MEAAAAHNEECVYGSLALADALAAYDAQKEKPRLSDLMRERYPDGLDAHKGKP